MNEEYRLRVFKIVVLIKIVWRKTGEVTPDREETV
jgi:hypothetical protein